MDSEFFICDNCENEVSSDSDFCPHCGSLFVEDASCINHPDVSAEGACVICCEAFCEQCGANVDDVFICNQHDSLEFIDGMVRVFGTNDVVQVEFAKDCLEKNGLHPFIFSKKASPMHLGGSDYSLFRASGEKPGNSINEVKLLVPAGETLDALRSLKELELTEE